MLNIFAFTLNSQIFKSRFTRDIFIFLILLYYYFIIYDEAYPNTINRNNNQNNNLYLIYINSIFKIIC